VRQLRRQTCSLVDREPVAEQVQEGGQHPVGGTQVLTKLGGEIAQPRARVMDRPVKASITMLVVIAMVIPLIARVDTSPWAPPA
jgi:hypothetical protein